MLVVSAAAMGFLIPAGGVLVAGIAAASEVWNASSGPRDTDPTSLENAISQVRQMQSSGVSNSQIASYLSGVVDRRMIAPDMFTPGEGLITALDPWNKRELIERHWRYRNPAGPQVRRIGASPDIERARWSWANGVGNCEEAASTTFSILNRAGIPVRYVRSNARGGHAFSVIGLADGANINDPSSWGPDAFVVDGWTGSALSAEQARNSRWHCRGDTIPAKFTEYEDEWTPSSGVENYIPAKLTDVTDEEHKPEMDRRWNEMAGKGVLSLIVVNGSGHRVSGARVKVATGRGAFTAATGGGGDAQLDLPTGNVTISIDPPANADLGSSSATATIQERLFTQVTVKLSERSTPIPPAPSSTAALHGSGSTEFAPGDVYGDATIISKQGNLKLEITIDPAAEQFKGTLSGRVSMIIGSRDGTRNNFLSSFTGSVRGSFHGSEEHGRLTGDATLTQASGGTTASGSGQFTGTVANGILACEIHMQDKIISFQFPVK